MNNQKAYLEFLREFTKLNPPTPRSKKTSHVFTEPAASSIREIQKNLEQMNEKNESELTVLVKEKSPCEKQMQKGGGGKERKGNKRKYKN